MKKLSAEEMKSILGGGGGGGGDIITCWVYTGCLNCPPGENCVTNPNAMPGDPDGMCVVDARCPTS